VRSSEGRRRRDAAWCWVVVAVSGLAVAGFQPWLSEHFELIKNRTDAYALPSPEQSIVLSLGYRAALADLIFAHVLVYYGIHFQEKRRFEFVGKYLETIVSLEPKYRDAYRYADTLLTLQPEPSGPEDYQKARELMERGMAEFPSDGELWLTAGQFFAYVAPGHLSDPASKREWRVEGARRLAHACELVGDDRNLPFQCITAAGLLSREGEREAMIQFLQRVAAVNDDPEILALVERAIRGYQVDRARVTIRDRAAALEELRQRNYPALNKDQLLAMLPPFDAAACAGVPPPADPECATSWQAWAASLTR
jgi:tetratricopeptide (TPR) repeat protein